MLLSKSVSSVAPASSPIVSSGAVMFPPASLKYNTEQHVQFHCVLYRNGLIHFVSSSHVGHFLLQYFIQGHADLYSRDYKPLLVI